MCPPVFFTHKNNMSVKGVATQFTHFILPSIITEWWQQELLRRADFLSSDQRIIRITKHAYIRIHSCRVALDGNEYLQKTPTLSSEPKKIATAVVLGTGLRSWFYFNGDYRPRPLVFRLLCNAKPVMKSCLVSRLFPPEMEDKNNSLNLTNVVLTAHRLRTPIDHSSFETSVTSDGVSTDFLSLCTPT
jgi:hypothetical protein